MLILGMIFGMLLAGALDVVSERIGDVLVVIEESE